MARPKKGSFAFSLFPYTGYAFTCSTITHIRKTDQIAS
jgi:hypothetical protein